MEGIRELLIAARDAGLVTGHFRGLLHIAIGRRISRATGATLSTGVTWRELAGELKLLRFDPELVRELRADPAVLAARDRERFWYSAIALAHVDTREASLEADKLVARLGALGYVIGPPPGSIEPSSSPAKKTEPRAKSQSKSAKKKKK
jgi:hypothetical protein